MATLKGFARWLRSLRALNAQRATLEQQVSQVADLRARFEQQQRALAEQAGEAERHARELHDVAARLEALEARTALASEQERQVRDGVRREITGITSRLDERAQAATELAGAVRRLEATADALQARLATIAPSFPALPDLASDDAAAWFHAAIEGRFRGPSEDIRERLRVYVPYVATLPPEAFPLPAVDLGCGRGEWLELLRDEGMNAIGIDDNPVSIERCATRGLEVLRGDALEYLRLQNDASIAVVSAFHVVEHLAPETMMSLLVEAWRVLAPGGLLLLETPNPENLVVGSSSFYLDPTHRQPIPLPLLRTFVEFASFDVVATVLLQPDDEMRKAAAAEHWPSTLARLLAGPRDAGIVARKPFDPAPEES